MSEHTIKIADGHLSFVYDDALGDLLDEGTAAVCRVSHVEPAPGGGWLADMSPVGGPVLYADGEYAGTEYRDEVIAAGNLRGFKTRAEALQAERDWLTKEKGL